MPQDDRKTLNPEKKLKKDHLTLEELGRLVAVAPEPPDQNRNTTSPFDRIYPLRLANEVFFQSPVDKSARTIPKHGKSDDKKSFIFDAAGVLQNTEAAKSALHIWLKPEEKDRVAITGALNEWLEKGTPTAGVLFSSIEEKLRKDAVTNELLYHQPICRLVRDDQLRYDPNYQVIYQLTPAQEQLVEKEREDSEAKVTADYDRVKSNQRVYWGISDTFQSLVALFDSDLGRGEDETGQNEADDNRDSQKTKELIRIAVQEKQEDGSSKATSLSPAGLNRYSPLRFWSPPPAFASCVFHMLFWRSIITGKDLFKRTVPGDDVRERAQAYYVIVNYFNPAKFRIADYPNLFKAILTIARELADYKPGSRPNDLPLPETGRASMFYPRYFPDVQPKFQEFEKLSLSIPFKSAYPKNWTVWDLAEAYGCAGGSDLKECLLKFLRDRAIELVLWSTYQMEIRSIGLIPVQYLYLIKLDNDLRRFFQEVANLHGGPVEPQTENFARIKDMVLEKMREPNLNARIKLIKAYGGPHRDVFCKEIIARDQEEEKNQDSGKKKGRRPIRWLEKYNSNPVKRVGVLTNADGSAEHDEEGNK